MDLVKELESQMREYGFIKDIRSLGDLEKIKLWPRYWADQTAIEIIQMEINIAFLRNPDLEGNIYIPVSIFMFPAGILLAQKTVSIKTILLKKVGAHFEICEEFTPDG